MIRLSRRIMSGAAVAFSAIAMGATGPALILADTSTTQPAAAAETPPTAQDVAATAHQAIEALGTSRKFSDPAWRASVGPGAIPPLKKLLSELNQLSPDPRGANRTMMLQQQAAGMLIALGDQSTIDGVNAMAASSNATDPIKARAYQLYGSWYGAGSDAAAQKNIVDELTKLDTAHPDSVQLTLLTAQMLDGAASAEMKQQLTSLISNTLTSPLAAQFKKQIGLKDQQAQQQAALESKPLIVKGVDINDAAFTTADWKGKVVLVDFWATWCGPCKAELPRVKQVYSQYHDKGLEIVGVSNDYSAEDLKEFIVKENMPWPQLFDASAAATQDWNPITKGLGIDGIPTMYLIDRKGIVRSVTARQDMETLIPKLLAEGQ